MARRPLETVEIMEREGFDVRFNARKPGEMIELEIKDERRANGTYGKTA